jgi:uncharacterized membrane protein YdjX (TVP38/TMEM64 family)
MNNDDKREGAGGEKNDDNVIAVLKNVLSILIAIATGGVAILFAVYGLSCKSLPFISNNLWLLIWLVIGFVFALLIAYFILFLLKKQAYYRLILCILFCLAFFAIVFFIVCSTGVIAKIDSIEALREYISQAGSWAVALFIIFQFLQVVILPIPGNVTVAAGVVLFGPLLCSLYSFIGIFLGSIVAFAVGRVVGYKAVCWIVGKDDLDKWLDKIKGKDYLILSLMFLLPLFPDDILCFVAGLSSMTWLYFLIMIAITRAISVLSTAFSLHLIPFNTWWGILIWVCIIALVVLAFYLVCKYSDNIDKFIKTRFKHNKKGKNKKK